MMSTVLFWQAGMGPVEAAETWESAVDLNGCGGLRGRTFPQYDIVLICHSIVFDWFEKPQRRV